jgi:hypothetical protein
VGSTASSSGRLKGMGTSSVTTRAIGARRWSKPSSATRAAISAATPQLRWHSSATTSRPVLATEARTVEPSNGTRVRGSTTSTSTPSPARVSAASNARVTMNEVATMVRSLPSRATRARPKGMGSRPSGTGPLESKSRTWLTKTVGLSLATAVRSRPSRSAGLEGAMISSPGVFQSMAWGLCECWAAPPTRMPWLRWSTSGTRAPPPVM